MHIHAKCKKRSHEGCKSRSLHRRRFSIHRRRRWHCSQLYIDIPLLSSCRYEIINNNITFSNNLVTCLSNSSDYKNGRENTVMLPESIALVVHRNASTMHHSCTCRTREKCTDACNLHAACRRRMEVKIICSRLVRWPPSSSQSTTSQTSQPPSPSSKIASLS